MFKRLNAWCYRNNRFGEFNFFSGMFSTITGLVLSIGGFNFINGLCIVMGIFNFVIVYFIKKQRKLENKEIKSNNSVLKE